MAWDWDKLQQQKQGKPGGSPPQMDEILEKIKSMKGKFGGSWIIIIVLLIIFIGWSMVYTVAVDEVGVVQRFGNMQGQSPPALTLNFPQGSRK